MMQCVNILVISSFLRGAQKGMITPQFGVEITLRKRKGRFSDFCATVSGSDF
jgi:hypothetical protein